MKRRLTTGMLLLLMVMGVQIWTLAIYYDLQWWLRIPSLVIAGLCALFVGDRIDEARTYVEHARVVERIARRHEHIDP